MKLLTIVLTLLIAVLTYTLFLGKDGWLQAWDLRERLKRQQLYSKSLKLRNEALEADVSNLKQGMDAIEERARDELGLIKPNEVFYQYQTIGLPPTQHETVSQQ